MPVKQVKCPAPWPGMQDLLLLGTKYFSCLSSHCCVSGLQPCGRLLLCAPLPLCLCGLCSVFLHGLPLLALHIHTGFPVWPRGCGLCHSEDLGVIVGAFLYSSTSPSGVGGVRPGTTQAESASIQLCISHQLTPGLGAVSMLNSSLFKNTASPLPPPTSPPSCF